MYRLLVSVLVFWKRFLGFVETDTENEKVLTLVLRSVRSAERLNQERA